MSETYLITGVAGFIGSHLCRALLSRDCRVIGVDNFDPFYDESLKQDNLRGLVSPEFQFIKADIRDKEAIDALFAEHRPNAVFHLAALAGVRPSIENPARYASVNLDGLVTMLDAAREHGVSRFVFASSSSVYGNNKKVPFAETDSVDEPISPYAATKKAGELICHTYAHLFRFPIAALRFFTVFGPAQRPDLAISKFMGLIARGESVPMFGDGTTSRDYTFIDDIIEGVLASEQFLKGADAGTCRIFNLGGSHPVTLSEMIEQIGAVVGKTPRIERLPMQPGDVNRTWADLARSSSELGYRPQTSFKEGLVKQWEWLRERADIPVG